MANKSAINYNNIVSLFLPLLKLSTVIKTVGFIQKNNKHGICVNFQLSQYDIITEKLSLGLFFCNG